MSNLILTGQRKTSLTSTLATPLFRQERATHHQLAQRSQTPRKQEAKEAQAKAETAASLPSPAILDRRAAMFTSEFYL